MRTKLIFLCLFLGSIFSSQAQNIPPHIGDGTLRRIHVPILMYHYISPLPPDADEYRIDLTVEPEIFRAHLQYLRNNGYTSISLYEIDQALLTGALLPPKPVVLTFDDGYIDHYTYAFPLLQEFEFTGTFFIITNTADSNLPAYLSWQQIQEMANAGMSMESHTKTHPDLRQRERDFLVYEILGSSESLAAHLGRSSHMFAYPGGRYDNATLALLSETDTWRAVTTEHGALHTTDNRLEMMRLRVSGNMTVLGLEYLLRSQ